MKSAESGLSLIEKVLMSVAAAAALYSVFHFISMILVHLPYRYGIGLGEAPMSQAIDMLRGGQWPYRDLSTPPFSLVPYGPVYLCVAGWLKSWVGGGPFLAGRLVTTLATGGTAFLIAAILRRAGLPKPACGVLAAVFLFHPYVLRWGFMVNVDMCGVFFDLLAFYCYFTFLESEKKSGLPWILWVGIASSVAAFYVKSSMVAAPAALFLTLVFKKRFKTAVIFFLVLSGITGLILIYLNHATQGQYWFHTTEIRHRLFFAAFIERFWAVAFRDSPVWVTAGLCYFVYGAIKRRLNFFYAYFFIAVLLTLSLGKQGSDTNYFLPCCALAPVMLGFFLRSRRELLWALVILQWAAWMPLNGSAAHAKEYFEKTAKVYDRISEVIRRMPGPVLSTDMSLLVTNGKQVYYEPFPMGQMSYSGLWDDRIITEKLDQKVFSMAIFYFYAPKLRADRNYTKNFMTAFNRNYELKARLSLPEPQGAEAQQFFFYGPKALPESPI